MDSPGEILSLCRLCLVKDQVNIPIFEEQGDIRQIFLKISSCLPVTITRHDQLPKKICDGCSNKLDLLYEFWNSSASAEKTLLSWLGQAGVADAGEKISAVAQQIAKPAETLVKEESETLDESHLINESNVINEANLTNESRDSFEENSLDEDTKDEAEAPPPKRARRTAAVKAQINITPESDEDDDEDYDAGEAMTKMEDESDESESELKDDPSYSEVAGTSADDQAGPSGVGKDGVEAPFRFVMKVRKVGPDSFTCRHCGKYFTTKIFLREHIVHVHTHDYRFFCQFCDRGFYMKCRKKFHEKNVHQKVVARTPSTPWTCEECGKTLANKYSYKQHKFLVHKRQINYCCDKCGKGFPLFSYLMQHEDVNHPKHEPLSCPEENCGKKFKTKDSLRRHKLIHEKHREFCCEFCPKKFIHIASFKRHLKEHKDGKKVFVCDVCKKVVFSTTSLQDHMRIHTGEKPYTCQNCDKTFISNKQLKTHIVVHTKEKKHVCRVCDKRYTQRSTLKSHFLKNHPNDIL